MIHLIMILYLKIEQDVSWRTKYADTCLLHDACSPRVCRWVGTLTRTALVFNSATQTALLALPRRSLLNRGEDKREPSYFFVLSNVRCLPDRRNHMGSALRGSDVGKIASPPNPLAYWTPPHGGERNPPQTFPSKLTISKLLSLGLDVAQWHF